MQYFNTEKRTFQTIGLYGVTLLVNLCCVIDRYPVGKCDVNKTTPSSTARAGSDDHQKPIGNALTTILFKDLRK